MTTSSDDERRAARYVDLLRDLGREIGESRGWQTRVAETLGVSRSVVSNLLRGRRSTVSSSTLNEAMRRLAIDPAYFEGTGHYREYLVGPRHGVTVHVPGAKPRTVTSRSDADAIASTSDTDMTTFAAMDLLRAAKEDRATAADGRRFCRTVVGLPYVRASRDVLEGTGMSDQMALAASITAAKLWAAQHGQDEDADARKISWATEETNDN